MKRILIILFLIGIILPLHGQEYQIPKYVKEFGQKELNHSQLSICYSKKNSAPLWVTCKINRNDYLNQRFHQNPEFSKDSLIKRQPSVSDYDNSELKPVPMYTPDLFRFSLKGFTEAGYMTTTVPMTKATIRQWQTLERLTCQWARIYDTLWICSGSIYEEDLGRVTGEKIVIPVPSAYFRTILRKTENGWTAIGFMIKNTKHWPQDIDNTSMLKYTIIPLSELEEKTGLTLFPMIEGLEKKYASFSDWKF